MFLFGISILSAASGAVGNTKVGGTRFPSQLHQDTIIL